MSYSNQRLLKVFIGFLYKSLEVSSQAIQNIVYYLELLMKYIPTPKYGYFPKDRLFNSLFRIAGLCFDSLSQIQTHRVPF